MSFDNTSSDFFNVKMASDREKIYHISYFHCFLMILKTSFLRMISSVFNIFDESIQGYLKLKVLLYADDTVLFAESEEELQQLPFEFQPYCSRWKLRFIPDKSKIVIFGHRSAKRADFTLNDQILKSLIIWVYFSQIQKFSPN